MMADLSSNQTMVILAVIALVPAWFAYLAKRQAKQTHLLVNSRMDELLRLSKTASKAEGKLEGVQEEKERQET